MDDTQAKQLIAQLVAQKEVAGWTIVKPLGFGKSAVVVLAEQDGIRAALKIFHPELLEKYGVDTQLKRIAREQQLVGKVHPHLVQILGGGQCATTKHVYVAMEALDGPQLSNVLKEIPSAQIPVLAMQLAGAAKFLEEQAIVHRDIKPDNLMLIGKTYDNLKLTDLGVIRPLAATTITDGPYGTPFLGTLRYSPPEFLHGRVDKSPDGWRAVTFYQIGAVLHDLIMRKQIFLEFSEPYAELVRAVDEIIPEISSNEVDKRVVSLAMRCLVKNPEDRLKLVDWTEFLALGTPSGGTLEEKKSALSKKQLLVEITSKESALARTETARIQQVDQIKTREQLRSKVDRALEGIAEVCPPRTVTTMPAMHPNASVGCVLHQDTRTGLKSDLHCEFAVEQSKDGEAVTIFVRISDSHNGAADTASGWITMGAFDRQMVGLEEHIEAWLVDFIESAIDAQT